MRTRTAVRLVRVGPLGAVARHPNGTTTTLPAGKTAWLPLATQLLGDYVVLIARAERRIEHK